VPKILQSHGINKQVAWLSLKRPIVLRTTYGTVYDIAAELNRRKCRVWNGYGHMTTLPMVIPDAEILAVRYFAVCWR